MARLILNRAEVRTTGIRALYPLVAKTLRETLALSRRYVPVRTPRPYDKRPTGRLKRSLRQRGPYVRVASVTGQVGSTLPFAISVHDGAAAHAITARYKPELVFFWEKRGHVFRGLQVHHPGVPPQSRTQYLYLPLVVVGRRNGFTVRRLRGLNSNLP